MLVFSRLYRNIQPNFKIIFRYFKKNKFLSNYQKKMRCYLQIIGTDNGVSNPSLLLFFDEKRYLFNVGEGCQRICNEYKIRLGKICTILCTRISSSTMGGIPGLFLTLSDINNSCFTSNDPKKIFNLVGPLGSSHFLASSFIFMKNSLLPHIQVGEFNSNTDFFQDDLINVKSIILNEYKSEPPKKKLSFDREIALSPPKLLENHPDSPTSLCLIVKLPDIPGKFCPEKAINLGLRPGKEYGELQKGNNVVLEDNKIIYSSDVISSSHPGDIFCIIDCPNESYLDSLFEYSKKFPFNSALVVHIVPNNIITSNSYQKWLVKTFCSSTQHIALNNSCISENVFCSASIHQQKLNYVHPSIFPFPLKLSETKINPPIGWTPARLLLKYNFSPISSRGWDQHPIENKFQLPPNFLLAELSSIEGFMDSLSELKNDPQIIESLQVNVKENNSYNINPEIVFLGTGSALPSKYRNVSSCLLRLSEGSIMFDAGEGSFGQLVQLFGREQAENEVLNIHTIFISHLHADHHLGLLSLLSLRINKKIQPIIVIGPTKLAEWLESYSSISFYDIKNSYLFIDSKSLFHSGLFPNSYLSQLGFSKAITVPVIHSQGACGIVMHHQHFSIVYSGDTRPCKALIDAGYASTILIHEATFENNLEDEAKNKKHCTVYQAIEVSKHMQAKFSILTHFSQRYPKLTNTTSINNNIFTAFDLMRARINDFLWLPKLNKTLRFLFSDSEDLY